MLPFAKRLTFDDRKKIEELIRLNFGTSKISEMTGFSESAIKEEYRRGGGRDNYKAEEGQRETLRRKRILNGVAKVPIEDDVLLKVKEKIDEGWSITKIRTEFKIGHRRLQRAIAILEGGESASTTRTFDERLCVLEMQIEIITEQLRRINEQLNRKDSELRNI